MPIHDWSRAPSGYFHHFHQRWTGAICDVLNTGVLPKGIFALVEQYSGAIVPDVLALDAEPHQGRDWSTSRGGLALATEPPNTRFVAREDQEIVYAAKANQVVLHRQDETIAVIEIVSPGNKGSQLALKQFVEKSLELLERGIHLLVVDLFPPTRRDPQAIHPEIWSMFSGEPFALPGDKRLTLASYVADTFKTVYVEPVSGGDSLPAMPLYLDTKRYIRVPLEDTYETTWKACPEEFKQRVIGGAAAAI